MFGAGCGIRLYRFLIIAFLSTVYEELLRSDQEIFNVELCAMSLIKKKFDKVGYHYKNYVSYNILMQFIFYFWSFEISVNILRNQK